MHGDLVITVAVSTLLGAGVAALIYHRRASSVLPASAVSRRATTSRPPAPRLAEPTTDPVRGVVVMSAPHPSPVTLVVTSSGGPFAEVQRLPSAARYKTEPIPRDTRITTGIQALLQRAPALAREIASVAGDTYVVRFAPEVARGLSDGTLSMMRAVEGGLRASAIDATGKVVGNAVLTTPAVAVSSVMVVWQVLAIITAQKFLADINKRLAGIERGVAGVKTWLIDEQHGGLEGDLRYLRQTAECLQRRDLTESDIRIFGDHLEAIGRQAQQLMARQERRSERFVEFFSSLTLTGFGFTDKSTAASRTVAEFSQASELWWLAAQVRGMAGQLRAPLPLSREVSLLRVQELRAEMAGQTSRQLEFLETGSRRMSELRGEFTFDSTDAEHQARLRSELATARQHLVEATVGLAEAAQTLEQQIGTLLEEVKRPLALVVAVDANGVPVEVRRVLFEAA